jgi:hypothetical protein
VSAPVRFRKTVAVLLILASIATPLALTAAWVRGQVLNTHRYVRTVTPLASDPAIVSAVADQITTALLARIDVTAVADKLVPPALRRFTPSLEDALHGYVQKLVEKSLLTSEFQRLWVIANTQAHEALVAELEGKPSPLIAPDGSVNVDLSNALLTARRALGATGLHVFDRIKPELLKPRFELVRPGSLDRVRHGVETLRSLSLALSAAAIGCFALAFVISRERRRTLLRAGIGLGVAGTAGIVAIVIGRSYYLHHIVGPGVPADAASAFYDTVLSSLRFWFKLVCVAGVVCVATAFVAGPSRFAVRIRALTLRSAGGVADQAAGQSVTLGWVAVAENKSALRSIVLILGLLLLVTSDHVTGRYVAEIAVGVLIGLGVIEILARPGASKRSGGAVP